MKNASQGRKRLPSEVSRAIASIRYVQHGFDRVDGHLNSSDPTLPLDKLNAESGGVRPILKAKSHAPAMGTSITILQPSESCLIALRDAIAGTYTLELNKVEIAADFMPSTSASRRWLQNWFLGHVTVKYLSHRAHRPEGYKAIYYGPRINRAGQLRSRVFVVYADRRTKLAGRHKGRKCVHIEMRLCGLDALQSVGIFSIADLIGFDFSAFWPNVIRLQRITNKAKLGSLLGGRSATVSDKALQKRAARLFLAHRIGSAFVLQNAVLAEAAAKGALEDIDMGLIFRFDSNS